MLSLGVGGHPLDQLHLRGAPKLGLEGATDGALRPPPLPSIA